MVQSPVPSTIDAIVSAFQAAGLTVWDGPVVTGDFSDAVFVGYDANPDAEFQAVTAHVQEWAGLGAKRRKETFTVVCAVVVLLGTGETVKVARDKAYSLLETVGATLRTDPSVGQPPPFVTNLRPNDLFTEPTDQGWQVRIPFYIDVDIARV